MASWYTLQRRQRVATELADVFAFFSRPENLALLTPSELGFEILTPSPLRMQQGALIDYVIRILGVPVRWRTMITAYDPPHRFVDEQLKGPYDLWHHTHEFAADGDGTLITDTVRYRLPLGPLGRLAHGLFVRRQLQGIFAHREGIVAEIFARGKDAS